MVSKEVNRDVGESGAVVRIDGDIAIMFGANAMIGAVAIAQVHFCLETLI